MMEDAAPPGPSIDRRYEVRDATVWVLVVFGFALCLMLAFTLLGSGLLVSFLAHRDSRTLPVPTVETGAERPPEPRLQTDPGRDLGDMRRAEDSLLGSYTWIDRQTGTVRIPIDRAMDLVAARLGAQSRPTGSSGRTQEQAPR
jgi:hypothetical protein